MFETEDVVRLETQPVLKRKCYHVSKSLLIMMMIIIIIIIIIIIVIIIVIITIAIIIIIAVSLHSSYTSVS